MIDAEFLLFQLVLLDVFQRYKRQERSVETVHANKRHEDLGVWHHLAPISEDNPGATYAYGMFVGERYGTTFQMHSGGWVAFSTMHIRMPERGLSAFAMCNGTQVSGPEVAEAVLGVLVGAD